MPMGAVTLRFGPGTDGTTILPGDLDSSANDRELVFRIWRQVRNCAQGASLKWIASGFDDVARSSGLESKL